MIGALALASTLGFAGEAKAERVYPWCAYSDPWTYNCGFTTFQQCVATVSGAGGICRPNPRFAVRDKRPGGGVY